MVVLTPPPVDDGDAPININSIITSVVTDVSFPISIVANPAVLDVTLKKNDCSHVKLVFFISLTLKTIVPILHKKIFIKITILL